MIDYKNPHLVMLFFEQKHPNNKAKNEQSFVQQMAYYEMLRLNGKVTMTGDLYNQHKFFVIVNVSCDSELEDILANDPAIKQNVCELARAMPFVQV